MASFLILLFVVQFLVDMLLLHKQGLPDPGPWCIECDDDGFAALVHMTREDKEPLILENPPEGQSQGCLYDCVYDCVSITQLEAYRDCVDFCGKTCTDKK